MIHPADKTTLSMYATKEILDPRIHAKRHPWVIVGGGLVLGYAVGLLLRRERRITTGVAPYYSPIYPFYPSPKADNAKLPFWSELERMLQEELSVVTNDFIRFGRHLLHEMGHRAVPIFVQTIKGHRYGSDPRS